jgi:phosphopantetheinyl transferase (holo-ACP synthase)
MEMTSKDPCLFLWRLDEEAPQLLALCREAGLPADDLLGLPVKRQREKAAERLLLFRAFGRPVTLTYTEQGAPLVEGVDVNISISHTQRLVVLATDDTQVIGVDAEMFDRPQVLRVRDKFLNDREKQFIAPDDLAVHVVAWTAKEAVIKAERNSAIDWTEGICLDPFVVSADETIFTARCGDRCYRLSSRLLEGHYITIAAPAIEQTVRVRQ